METSNLYLIMLLAGQVIPQLTDVINKHVPSAKIRYVASWLMPLVIATLANIERLQFGSLEEWAISLLLLSASSQSAYAFYYKGSEYQARIRFSSDPFPLKDLLPPVSLLAPKLQQLKERARGH
jgi:hypothetical protein